MDTGSTDLIESADLAGETVSGDTGAGSESISEEETSESSENISETAGEEQTVVGSAASIGTDADAAEVAVDDDAAMVIADAADDILTAEAGAFSPEEDVAAVVSEDAGDGEETANTEEYTYEYEFFTMTDYASWTLMLSDGADFYLEDAQLILYRYTYDSEGTLVDTAQMAYEAEISDYDLDMWTSISEDCTILYGLKDEAGIGTEVTVTAYMDGEAVDSVVVTIHGTSETIVWASYSIPDILAGDTEEVSIWFYRSTWNSEWNDYHTDAYVTDYTVTCTTDNTDIVTLSDVTLNSWMDYAFDVTGLKAGTASVTVTAKDGAENVVYEEAIEIPVVESYYTIELNNSDEISVALGENYCIYNDDLFTVYYVSDAGKVALTQEQYTVELYNYGGFTDVDDESGTFIERTDPDRCWCSVSVSVNGEALGGFLIYFASIYTYDLEYSGNGNYIFPGTEQTLTLTVDGEEAPEGYTVSSWTIQPVIDGFLDESAVEVEYSEDGTALTLKVSDDLEFEYEGKIYVYAFVLKDGSYMTMLSTTLEIRIPTWEITEVSVGDGYLIYGESTNVFATYYMVDEDNPDGVTGEATITSVKYVSSEWYDDGNAQPDSNNPDSFMEISQDEYGNWYVTSKMTKNNFGTVVIMVTYLDNEGNEYTEEVSLQFVREQAQIEGVESYYELTVGESVDLSPMVMYYYISDYENMTVEEVLLAPTYGYITDWEQQYFDEYSDDYIRVVYSDDYSLTVTGLTAGTSTISIYLEHRYDAENCVGQWYDITFRVFNDPELTGTTSYTYTYGQTSSFDLDVTHEGDGELTYEVTEGSDVISVDENGTVTVKGTGTATILVTLAETDDYEGATMEITVTVTAADSGTSSPCNPKETETETESESETETETETETESETETEKQTESETETEAVKGTTGLILDADGVFRYYEDGVFAEDYVGVVSYNGSLFFIKDGLIDTGANELCLYNDVWYYVSLGQVQLQYTGLAMHDGAWFYITKGLLDTTVNGLVPYGDDVFLVAAGKLLTDYNGLWENSTRIGGDGQWYFIAAGKVQAVSQVVMYNNEWFVVEKGILDSDYNGTIEYDGATFTVVNGQLYG